MNPILADRGRLVLYLIAWALVGLLLSLISRGIAGIDWMPALLFGLPLGLVAAPASLSAWYLCRAMPLSRTAIVRVGLSGAGAALVTASLWAALGQVWWRVLAGQGLTMAAEPPGVIAALLVGFGALAYLLSLTVQYVVQASEETAAAARRALESQVAQREAELRALRAQIDPHFLFNSLNAIAGLIPSDPDAARRMSQMLGDFLRDSLALGSAPRIALGREVALAEQYLRVEQVRFGRRLTVDTRVSPACAELPVPPLLLQPLVENAVRHGIATCLDGGPVEIAAGLVGTRAVITVTNPRDPTGGRRGTGLGLDIVRRRLAACWGEGAALAVEPAADSYRVSLTIPIEEPAA